MEYKAVVGARLALDDDVDGGELLGYASVFGNVDRTGERVLPGAFSKSLPAFIQQGYLGLNHDPHAPIGWIRDAAEDRHGLLVAARWHGDALAQTVRQRTRERLAAARDVVMSIGF